MGAWYPDHPTSQFMKLVFDTIVWLYANVLVACKKEAMFRSFSTAGSVKPVRILPEHHRYRGPICTEKGALNVTVHLKSLFATYQQNLENARKTPGWHTSTSGRHGGDLVQQATQKLRNAPRRALATLESKLHEKQLLHSSNCQKVGNALEQFALYFHRFSTEAFLQLATGAASSVWAGDIQNSDVIYHETSELDLQGHFRGYTVSHLLKSLMQDAKRKADRGDREHCLKAVEIGVLHGWTSWYFLESIPCLHLLSVDIAPKLSAWGNLHRFGNRSTLWKMTSEEASMKHSGKLDLVFVDAQHDYDEIVKDINVWRPKLRSGGIMAGHDYGPYWPAVIRAAHEFARSSGQPLHLGADYVWWVYVKWNWTLLHPEFFENHMEVWEIGKFPDSKLSMNSIKEDKASSGGGKKKHQNQESVGSLRVRFVAVISKLFSRSTLGTSQIQSTDVHHVSSCHYI